MTTTKSTLLAFAIAALIAITAPTTAHASPSYLVLSSYSSTTCDPSTAYAFNLTIPLGQCLNNHDFNSADCNVLDKCLHVTLPKQFPSLTFPYEALVACTGAPKMHLSVNPSFDASVNKLAAKIYPLVEACEDLPLTLHYSAGECASKFAVSKKCNVGGSSVSWI